MIEMAFKGRIPCAAKCGDCLHFNLLLAGELSELEAGIEAELEYNGWSTDGLCPECKAAAEKDHHEVNQGDDDRKEARHG